MRRVGVAFAALFLLVGGLTTSCSAEPEKVFEVLNEEQTAEDQVPDKVMATGGTTKELSAETSQRLLAASGFGYYAVKSGSGDVCLYIDPLNHPEPQLGTFLCQSVSAIQSNDGLRVGFSYKAEDGVPYYTHAILLPDNATEDAVPGGYERVGSNLALGPRTGDA